MAEYFNNFSEIAKRLHLAQSAAVRKVAFDIEADAKLGAPVDTGYLKSSIYASTSEGSDYSAGLPEVTPANDQEAVVGVGAEYGEYVNDGTVYQEANPFFTRAVEKNRPKLQQALIDAIRASLQ